MASTIFTPKTGSIKADWLNDVNEHVYNGGGSIGVVDNLLGNGAIRRYEDTISQLIANESHDLLIGSGEM